MADLKPIRSNDDYEDALRALSELWGARDGTPEGDKLDILATLIDAYEQIHFPMDEPSAEALSAHRAEQARAPQGQTTSASVFELYRSTDNSFAFRLKTESGEIVFSSEGFASREAALTAIERLKTSVSASKIDERAA